MRIVVDINHPAQVHFFKNFIWEMKKRGHEILITASKKDLAQYLISAYNFDCSYLGNYGKTLIRKAINVPIIDLKMYSSIRYFQPDIILGFGSIRAAHVAKMIRKPCINFDDDEYSYPFYHLFTDAICGFSGFKKQGPNIFKINGFKEIAYLRPNYFTPNPSILHSIGIPIEEKFCIVRFVSWNAFHDFGKNGFSSQFKVRLIEKLNEHFHVYISSEATLPKELEKYRLSIPPEHIHNFMYYANLLVSDSQTMSTEAAVLGIPAVRSNSFVGTNDMGNFIELENKYNLIYNCDSEDKTLSIIDKIIEIPNIKNEWARKRDILLSEKIDVTAFMVWFIDNYPLSMDYMREHPDIQYKCLRIPEAIHDR